MIRLCVTMEGDRLHVISATFATSLRARCAEIDPERHASALALLAQVRT